MLNAALHAPSIRIRSIVIKSPRPESPSSDGIRQRVQHRRAEVLHIRIGHFHASARGQTPFADEKPIAVPRCDLVLEFRVHVCDDLNDILEMSGISESSGISMIWYFRILLATAQ